MRKILSILVVALLIGGGLVHAGGTALYVRSGDQNLLVESISIVGSNAALSTIITAGNKVFGFTFSDSSAGVVAICDLAAIADYDESTGIFGEVYVAAGGTETVIFPLPKKLSNGLVTAGQNSTGRIVIYYE